MKSLKIAGCLLAAALSLGLLQSCGTKQFKRPSQPTEFTERDRAPREFRAAWVASVANINWPSKPGLSTAEQQKEAIELLDYLKNHHFNAVIFQVRPQADALYNSDLEPWSYYLTGKQGQAPKPYYDPLEFWIKEAHARGLELHVWLNPYRAHHTSGGEVSAHSIVKKMPESVLRLEQGYWWFDPSLQSTQDHSLAVVQDLVRRYDIDGVHFDDYFYPYASYNNDKDFPDDKSWKAYQASGGQLSRGDWRRQSVNTFIERVYRTIKAEKRHVKFGLSPFGIWRPGYPAGIKGMDQYESLYADAKLWLNQGWIDYFAPQLYWPIAQLDQSFPLLLGWWQDENLKGRHLWPGMNVGRSKDEANRVEINNQILISRGMLRNSPGAIHWSISSLTSQPELSKSIQTGVYKEPVLIPASPWLSDVKPPAPRVQESRQRDALNLSWSLPNLESIQSWVVYTCYGDQWEHQILPKGMRQLTIPLRHSKRDATLTNVKVTAVDRFGNESL